MGSGEGVVTLRAAVNDGKWHEVRLERHDNGAKISLDGGDAEEQGGNSIDNSSILESGPKPVPSHVWSYETCIYLECRSTG